MEQKFKNAAFISYSRKDAKVAEWFHKDMEHIRIPRKLPIPEGSEPLKRRIGRLFRDESDLPVWSSSFTEDIKTALAESEFLIVLCSPNSAHPGPDGEHFVDWEIKEFVNQHGLEYARLHIVPVIIEGDIKSVDPQTACVPPALREFIPDLLLERNAPVLGRVTPDAPSTTENAREQKEAREQVVLKTLSSLVRVDYNVFYNRFRKEQNERIRNWLVAAVCLILVLAALTAWAVIERKKAITNEGKAQTELSHSDYREASRLIEQGDTGMALAYLASSLNDITLPNIPLYRPAFARFYGLLLNRSWLVPQKVSPPEKEKGKLVAVSDSLDMALYNLGTDTGNPASKLLISRNVENDKPHEVPIEVDGFLAGAFSHDGKTLLTLVQDTSASRIYGKMLRTEDGSPCGEFALPAGAIPVPAPNTRMTPSTSPTGTTPVFISNTGAYVVLVSPDNTMRLVAVNDGRTLLEKKNDSGLSWGRFGFDDTDQTFVVAQIRQKSLVDKSVSRLHVYALPDCTELFNFEETGTIDDFALSPSGSFIAYVVMNESLEWKLTSAPLREGLTGWTEELSAGFKMMAFSPDGVNLAVEAGWQNPGNIKIYDIYSGPPSRYGLQMEGLVKDWAFSHDARRLAILDEDNEVHLLNTRDGSRVVEKLKLSTEAHSLVFSRNDRFISIRTAEQGEVRYGVQISPHSPRKLPLESPMVLMDVVLSDARSLLGFVLGNGKNSGELQIRSLTGNTSESSDTHDIVSLPKKAPSIPINGHPNCGAFSPDGKLFAIGTGVPTSNASTGQVFIYDIPKDIDADAKKWKTRPPIDLPYAVTHATFSPDGKLLAMTGPPSNEKSSKAYLYDVEAKTILPFEVEHAGEIEKIAFSRRSQNYHLITAGSDNLLKTWDIQSKKMLWQAKLDSFPQDLATTHDGKIACGMRFLNRQGAIQVFSATGSLLWKRKGLRHAVNHVTFDESGSLLAVGFRGNKAIILNAADGRPRTQELIHSGEINTLSFTSQGDTAALCVGGGDSSNGYVDYWDPVSSKKVSDTTHHDDQVKGLWISKDGRVVSWSHEVQLSPSPILFASQQLIHENYDYVAGTLSGWTLNKWRAPEAYSADVPPASSGPLIKAMAWLSDFSDSRTLFLDSGSTLRDRLDQLANRYFDDREKVLNIRPDHAEALANIWFDIAEAAAEEDFMRPFQGRSRQEKIQRQMEWNSVFSQKKWSAIQANPKAVHLADFHTREACDKRPDAAAVWRERATFLRLTDRIDEALVALKRSVALAPSDIDAAIQLALIYQEQRNNSAALDVLKKTCDEMASTGNGTINDVRRVGYQMLRAWAVEHGFSGIDGHLEWIVEQIRRRVKESLSMDDQTSLVDLTNKVSTLLLAAEDGPRKAFEFNLKLIKLLKERTIPPLESTTMAFDVAASYSALLSGDMESALQYTAGAAKLDATTALFLNMNRALSLCASGRIPEAMDLVRNVLSFDNRYDGFISLQMASDLQELRRHGISLPCEAELNTQLAPLISDDIAKGIIVKEVVPGGQGEHVGVQVGDRIIRYNGGPIFNFENFILYRNLEKNLESTESRELVIIRDGRELSFKVKPGLLGLGLVPGE